MQSVQKNMNIEEMHKQALSIGIESAQTRLLTFYVVNNTNSDINMLTWNTPFEQTLSADMFLIVRDGKELPYLGRKVKRISPGSDDFLLIPAGQKVESEMDIAKYYGMSEMGEYTVTISLPQIDGVTRLNQETAVTIETESLNVLVSQ